MLEVGGHRLAIILEIYNLTMLQTVLLALVVTSSVSLDCSILVAEWLLQPEKLPPIAYSDSGKFLNDYGDFNNCRFHQDEYTYLTMTVINKLAANVQFMGFCCPNECAANVSANMYSSKIENSLNQIYQNKTGTNNTVFVHLNFKDPVATQPQMGWGSYAVLALLAFLVILSITASVVAKVSASTSKPIEVLKCFSVYDNLIKVFTLPKRDVQGDNLLFLNGMRVLSIFWIVYGHTIWFRFGNIKNWMQSLDILASPGVVTLAPAGYFAVDSFFWIGGFLVTIGMLEQLKKPRALWKFYLECVSHRIIRIWPTYMLAILIYWQVAPYMGSGPIWSSYKFFANSCNNGGVLWNMLFIDNFGDHGPSGADYCFGWGWYLSVDFQLFLIAPAIMYLYAKSKKWGLLVTLGLFLSSVACAFILIVVNDWRYPIPNLSMKPQPEFMDDFYYKPYVRASAYFMGFFSGFFYYEWKNGHQAIMGMVDSIKKSVLIRISMYVIGITLCQFIIWIILPFQMGEEWSTFAQALYNSCNRVVFLIGVYLCVFAAMFGCRNDPSHIILGHNFFAPLAKVSFCIYLTHFMVIMNETFSARAAFFWTDFGAVNTVIETILWSIPFATFLSLMVEAPTLNLEKVLAGRGKPDNKKIKVEGKSEGDLQQGLLADSAKQRESLI